jgi:hypothetical protein
MGCLLKSQDHFLASTLHILPDQKQDKRSFRYRKSIC